MATSFLPQTSGTVTPPEVPTQDFFDVEKILESTPDQKSTEETEVNLEFNNETRKSEPAPEQNPVVQEKIQKKKGPVVHRSPASLYIAPDQVTAQIEKIMEEGIGDAYQELTPIQKQQFKIQGEKTAKEIKQLLQASKVKVKKIFQALLEWLKLLPGINRFYLMQEAKIKTDKILGLKDIQPQ